MPTSDGLIAFEQGARAHALIEFWSIYHDALQTGDTSLIEGKDIGTFRGTNIDRHIASTFASNLEPEKARWRKQKRTQRNRQKLKSVLLQTEDDLVRVWKRFQKGDIAKTRLGDNLREILKRAYRQAMVLGVTSSEAETPVDLSRDLSSAEQSWLDSFIQQEGKHLAKLIDDMIKGTSRQNVEYRLKRYTRTVNSVFDAARTVSASADSIIEWKTHSVAPCASCTTLGRHSPYTVATLPTTPKAGATLCLDNCKCTLEFKKGTPEEVLKIAKRNGSMRKMIDRLLKVKKTKKPILKKPYKKPSAKKTYNSPTAKKKYSPPKAKSK